MDIDSLQKIVRYIVDIVLVACLAITTSFFLARQVRNNGYSMTPTINDKSLVLVNQFYGKILPLKKNDIIVFYQNGVVNIKRVYGVPNDRVSIRNGNFYINDIRQNDEFVKNSLSTNMEQEVHLDIDEYYVLGDNLDSSKDSRYQDVGNIKRSDIIGKVWRIMN